MLKITLAATALAISTTMAIAAGPAAGTYTAKFGGGWCGQLNIQANGQADYKYYQCNNHKHIEFATDRVVIENKGGNQYLFKIGAARYDAAQKGKRFDGKWTLNGWSGKITFR